MIKKLKEELAIRRKLIILNYARETGKMSNTCREFEVTRSLFYKWKKAFDLEGKAEHFVNILQNKCRFHTFFNKYIDI